MADFEAAGLTFSDDQTPTPEVVSSPRLAKNLPELTFSEVDNTPQAVFDEGRGKVYEIPAGMEGHAADHAIGTTFEGRSRDDYFGLIDLGKDFVKGLASGTLDLAEIPAQALIYGGEMLKGGTQKGNAADGPVFGMEPPVDGEPRSLADVQIQMGRALSKSIEGFKSETNLTPSDPESGFSKLAFGVGSGTGNILTSIGIAALAASSSASTILGLAFFGAQSGAQAYKKSRSFGINRSPLQAAAVASGESALTVAVNGLGLKVLSASVRMGSGFKRAAALIMEQSAEEALDQGSQDIYENLTGLQKKSAEAIIKDMIFSAMVGGIVSSPASVAVNAHIKSKYTQALVDLGIPEEKANAFIDIQTEKTLASPEFHKAAVQLAVDQVSEQAMPSAERVANLQQVDKWHNELAAEMDVDLQAVMGADAMKQKISDEMGRIESEIQTKVNNVVRFIEDKQLDGMQKEEDKNRADKVRSESKRLIETSDTVLAKIDELEAQKSELEANKKSTSVLDKRITALEKQHDKIDEQLGNLIEDSSGLKEKAVRQRALNRIDRLSRRAEAISKEATALEEVQKATQDLKEKSDVKITSGIEKRLQELAEQYDTIDEELANLLHDQKTISIPESSFVRMSGKSMDAITARAARVMEEAAEAQVKAFMRLEGKVDKSYEKLANRVATIARIAEKKRIHEALKILRQIKTADIEGITIKERRAILEIRKELEAIKGSPSLKQLHDINDRIQFIKEEGKRRLADIVGARKDRFNAQKLLFLKVLGAVPTKGITAYHGTTKTFTKFSSQFSELGFHFGTEAQARDRVSGIKGAQVLKVVLDIKNPYDVVSDLGNWSDMDMLREYFGPANEGPFTKEQVDGFDSPEDFIAGLQKLGYDGIKYRNAFEDDSDKRSDKVAYIAFNPEQISVQKENEPYTGPEQENWKEKLKSASHAERAAFLHPVRLLEMIDGDNNGIFKDAFFKSVNRAVNTELVQRQEALARLQEILKGNGVTLEELANTLKVAGLNKEITISQAMHIYGALGNDLQMLAITEDNGFSKTNVEAIEKALADKYKATARDIVAEFSTHAARLNVALLDYTDGKQDLKLEGPNYIPMHRDNPDSANLNVQQQIEEDHDLRATYRQRIVEQGLVKERVNRGANAKLNPIRLGLVEAYTRHVQTREHFISLARTVKDLNATLADKEIHAALVEKFGTVVSGTLQDYVNVVATDSVVKAHNAMSATDRKINQFARDARHAAAFVHLGWNIVSVAKVPVSIAAALGHVTPVHLMSAIGDIMSDQKKVMDFAYARDPQLQAAEFSKEQQEFRDPTAAMKQRDALGKYKANAFNWMRALDQWTRVTLWTAAYNQKKDLKVSEQEAIDFAQELVLRTQPATMNKDLAGIFATNNELLNMVTQFTHQVNQNYGILTHDLPRAWQGGRQDQAMGMAFGLVIMMILEYAISSGELPTEPEDITEGLVQGSLYMTPIVGPMLNAMHNGFSSSAAGADLFIGKGVKGVQAAFDGDFGKVLDNAFYFGAAFGKLPYTQIRRTLMGAYDLSTGETDDYRRLVWSNYQLNRDEE